jgi:chromosome partitioning protein
VRAIAVTNQKGGVAKTTTVHNLGVALQREGQRVLVVDLDPQANLTSRLGLSVGEHRRSVYEVLVNHDPIRDVIHETADGIDLVPSDELLMRAEGQMEAGRIGWVRQLHRALDPIRGRYDFCLFDTPPVRGFLTVNALIAATSGVIIPFIPELDSLIGMQLLLGRMDELRGANPNLEPIAVIPVLVDRNWRNHLETIEQIKARMPHLPLTQPIMRHADFPKARAAGMSILDYAPNGAGARAYRDLAAAILGAEIPAPPVPTR